ncbi:MAG TPA: hypothetical protein PKJ78_21695 [Candidatus Hydrogenedentes bacterium]|nr:hypothetical protein [Candidatus Hydrogenedentota bacterium]
MSELVGGMGFKGMSPALDDEALSAEQAAYAVNVDLYRGLITPTKADMAYSGSINDFDPGSAPAEKTRVFAVPATGTSSFVIVSSVYDHAAYAVNVNGELEIILAGPGGGYRLRRSRSGEGIVIYDSSPYEDVTVLAPSVSVTRVDENASVTRYTSVRVAYVFADGYETSMGPVSEEIGYVPGDTLVVAPVDEALLPVKPSAIRLYIAVAGTDDVQWKYLGEFTDVSYATEIVLENDIAGEIMEVYDTVPSDIRTVCAAPWGGFAFTSLSKPGVVQFTDGLEFRRVWTSYEINTGGTVKALLSGNSCVFVLCDDGGPFVISGTGLGNLTRNSGTSVTPLVSTSAGAAVYNDTCLYVSSHGLVTVSSAGTVSPFTEEPVFSQEQWAALAPEGIALAFASDGAVVFASPTGKTGIIKSYGLVWKTGKRRSFATLPHDKSLVYL